MARWSTRSSKILSYVALNVALAGGVMACASEASDADDDAALEGAAVAREVSLTDAERSRIVEKKATCPFIGALVAMKKLVVLGTPSSPLARITGEDSVAALGDTGEGSNLGSAVLTLFARGNHHFMLAASGKLDEVVPEGTFSLDFPASQGSHPGHSGILQTDPARLDSGAFSAKDFERLVALKGADQDRCKPVGHAETLPDGRRVVRRSEIGRFIAENLRADPNSKVAGLKVFLKLGIDTGNVAGSIAALAHGGDSDAVFVKLTKLLGEDNLVGSAGEFGLLMAFLAESPNTVELDGEPAVSVDELTLMFGAKGERRLPDGWASWKKTKLAWVVSTLALTNAAALHHAKLGLGCK